MGKVEELVTRSGTGTARGHGCRAMLAVIAASVWALGCSSPAPDATGSPPSGGQTPSEAVATPRPSSARGTVDTPPTLPPMDVTPTPVPTATALIAESPPIPTDSQIADSTSGQAPDTQAQAAPTTALDAVTPGATPAGVAPRREADGGTPGPAPKETVYASPTTPPSPEPISLNEPTVTAVPDLRVAPTATATPPSPTSTAVPTAEPTPRPTPSPTAEPTPEVEPTATRTPRPTATPTVVVEPTSTPETEQATDTPAPVYGRSVGDAAIPFVLPSSAGPEYRLQDLRGEKVVLVFYRAFW